MPWYDSPMYLENIAVDARDPGTVGRFWEALLGCTTLTDEPDAFETRMSVPGGPDLDLCFQRVAEPAPPDPRLHLDLAGGERQAEVVERALGLGARHLDIGQGDVPWVVLADPEGNPFCVMEHRPEYASSGPIAALPLDSADVERDTRFWSELSGWVREDTGDAVGAAPPLRARAPARAVPRAAPQGCGQEPPAPRPPARDRRRPGRSSPAGSSSSAAASSTPDWGDLPWRVLADPSGNELCLLPARTT